jgi:2,5-diketo-D-gluconate reductase B
MQVVRAHGAEIPALGFGTWPMRGETCARIVSAGLKVGYRHIDTAQGYENEDAVGEGMRAAGIPREDIFIATKVHPDRTSESLLVASVEDSLRRLGTDYVDLLIPHWPNPKVPVAETIRALCDAKRRGLTRHIGLSNYTIALVEEAHSAATEPLVAAQVEYHPFLDQTKMLAELRRRGMAIIAYCPLALGRVADDPTIKSIATAHRKTAAQVALRWLLRQDKVVAIPKTANTARLSENFEVFDFDLTGHETERIDALRRPGPHLVNEPAWVPVWD